ncbi:MAG TPA: lipopolysaccharide heptosyltransferase II [Terriglobia bacterium]|nr:lipopolysaccharide heptosyltransferase II [Terriglobia bacterium]
MTSGANLASPSVDGRADPQKIMVRATNWIGDAVMSFPALETLRARFPKAEIVVVAKSWVGELYWHHPAVSRQIVYSPEGRHRGPGGFWKLVQTLRAERFDLAILLQNAFHAAWMAWCARIPVRVGYARDGRSSLLTDAIEPPLPAAYGHQTQYYLQLLFRAGLADKPEAVREIRLAVQETEKAWATRHLIKLGLGGPRFLVGLNPGASFGPAKRWPAQRFAQLADRLIGGLHADVLIFGSREERPLAEEIARAMQHTPTVLAGDTSLRQLMATLAQCRLVITNDSGPMHLAAALGVPVVAVFGSTDERATGPVGSRTWVVNHPVDCSPCGLRECPIDFRCMNGLTVDDVYMAALMLVRKLRVTHEG